MGDQKVPVFATVAPEDSISSHGVVDHDTVSVLLARPQGGSLIDRDSIDTMFGSGSATPCNLSGLKLKHLHRTYTKPVRLARILVQEHFQHTTYEKGEDPSKYVNDFRLLAEEYRRIEPMVSEQTLVDGFLISVQDEASAWYKRKI
jgi:hypothetical protein